MNRQSCGKAKLFVVSGPSGVGKGTVCDIVLKRSNCVRKSVSVTTRAPREGEREGINYYFVTLERYTQLKEADGFLETFEIYGNFYGTPKQYVEQNLAEGKSVLLEIDVQGAMAVKQKMPQAVLIFIAPPNIDTLTSRLIGRKSESADSLKRRIESAKKELAMQADYDYTVVNDRAEEAAKQIMDIIKSQIHG